jgi:hypothetical protein
VGGDRTLRFVPGDAAFSPDGKWLYLTGYHVFHIRQAWIRWSDYMHGVVKVAFAAGRRPVVFKGTMSRQGSGSDDEHLHVPTSVACDARGNVYVADYLNDRVQVFDPGATLLRSISVGRPTVVRVHPRTGELYVFSWLLPVRPMFKDRSKVEPTLTVLGPADDPKPRAVYSLPHVHSGPFGQGFHMGTDRDYAATVDFWTDPPTVWLGFGMRQGDWGRGEFGTPNVRHRRARRPRRPWADSGVKLLVPRSGRLVVVQDFGRAAAASVKRARPPRRHAQHLFVNPRTGRLYVLEYLGKGSGLDGLNELIEIDPGSGDVRLVALPFVFEDLAFDAEGLAYFQLGDVVMRYDLRSGAEVPWDYGESRVVHGYRVASGLPLRGFASWHHWAGKMCVSVTGKLAVSVRSTVTPAGRKANGQGPKPAGWSPRLFPGRAVGEYLHVWDRHGKLVHRDVLPGLGNWSVAGVGIDRSDDLFAMVNSRSWVGGKDFFLPKTGALLKVSPGRARLITDSAEAPVPLPDARRPTRERELRHGWLDGAAWVVGGVGFNTDRFHCLCWHANFRLDYFGRSFVPQPAICRVAVLDTNGNLVTHVGRYGNADSAGAGSRVPLGGDEVGLLIPSYVAVHSDRRLFIADPGNGRIVSVRLGYHAGRTVRLADVPSRAEPVRQGS